MDSAGGGAGHVVRATGTDATRHGVPDRGASQKFQVVLESRPAEQAQASGSRATQQLRSFKLRRAANDSDSEQLGQCQCGG